MRKREEQEKYSNSGGNCDSSKSDRIWSNNNNNDEDYDYDSSKNNDDDDNINVKTIIMP